MTRVHPQFADPPELFREHFSPQSVPLDGKGFSLASSGRGHETARMTVAPNEPTDESLALTAAARASDAQTAFGVLMRRYTVRLLRYLSSLNVPDADADDLASGVW